MAAQVTCLFEISLPPPFIETNGISCIKLQLCMLPDMTIF